MKHVKILLVLVFACTVVMGYSQKKSKPFVGIINYDISYTGETFTEDLRLQMPGQVNVKIREGKINVENISPMYTMSMISDIANSEKIILIDMMGQKMGVKMSKEDLPSDDDNDDKFDIKELNESKTISGYKCEKYQMALPGSEDDYIVLYVTKDIEISKELNKLGFIPVNIEGGILEVVIYQGNDEITYTTNEIKKGKAKKSDFMITDDYTEMTPEEFKAMTGQ